MKSLRLSCYAVFLATLQFSLPAFGEANKAIKGFIPVIKPLKASAKASPADLGALNKQMIAAMNYLGKHHDKYGKDGGDIIELALQNYGDEMFSGFRASLLRTSLSRTWEKSNSLGLFNKRGQFDMMIRSGPETGKKASFEYIVLPKEYPQYSTDLTNLRLVTPATRRDRNEERQTTLEKVYAKSLGKIEGEILHGRADSLGRNTADNLELWKKSVEANEGALERQPTLRLAGKVTGTRSRSNGDKWKVSFSATNISPHPTEVTAQLFIFGITDEENEIFLLRKTSVPVKLRKNEIFEQDLLTGPRSNYAEMATRIDQNKPTGKIKPLVSAVKMRGWAIVVKHKDKMISQAGSMPMMLEYVDRAGSLPGNKN